MVLASSFMQVNNAAPFLSDGQQAMAWLVFIGLVLAGSCDLLSSDYAPKPARLEEQLKKPNPLILPIKKPHPISFPVVVLGVPALGVLGWYYRLTEEKWGPTATCLSAIGAVLFVGWFLSVMLKNKKSFDHQSQLNTKLVVLQMQFFNAVKDNKPVRNVFDICRQTGRTFDRLREAFGVSMVTKSYFEQSGIDFNRQDEDGFTVLMHAVRNQNIDMVIYLLAEANDQSIDLTLTNKKGQTARDIALQKGYESIAELLKNLENNKSFFSWKNAKQQSEQEQSAAAGGHNNGASGAFIDHYQNLGIQRNATIDEIKRAFRTLAMQYHPDRGGDSEKFKQIGTAYEVLSDAQKRKNYDDNEYDVHYVNRHRPLFF